MLVVFALRSGTWPQFRRPEILHHGELTPHGPKACKHVLPSPEEVIAGYRTLHTQEEIYNRRAIEAMPEAVRNWYRHLTLYDRVMRREYEWPKSEPDDEYWSWKARLIWPSSLNPRQNSCSTPAWPATTRRPTACSAIWSKPGSKWSTCGSMRSRGPACGGLPRTDPTGSGAQAGHNPQCPKKDRESQKPAVACPNMVAIESG